jgi:hypothetical protein
MIYVWVLSQFKWAVCKILFGYSPKNCFWPFGYINDKNEKQYVSILGSYINQYIFLGSYINQLNIRNSTQLNPQNQKWKSRRDGRMHFFKSLELLN